MSLMQLLAVGKSIRTIRNRPSPYRMTQQNLLPRFGESRWEGKTFEGKHLEGKLPEDRSEAGNEVAQSGKSGTPGSAGEAAQAPSGVAYPSGRWTILRRHFGFRTSEGKAALIQGELRLDAVRVVRNDLSDSDLEVIPARAAKQRRERAGAGWLERVLHRLGRRLFGTQDI